MSFSSVNSVYSLLIVLVTLLTICPQVMTTSCTADWSCGTNEYCNYQSCLTAGGASVTLFYPFGSANGDKSLIGDDAKAVVSTSLAFPFAGTTYSYMFISSNGLISLGNDKAAPFSQLDPRAFPIENATFIAPLWLDYDNRQSLSNSANSIYYRVVSDETTLSSISDDVKENFELSADFSATSAVIATWFKVAKWKRFSDNLNTFQVVLATDGQKSYAILFYNHIGTTKVHGLYARAGFNANSAGVTSMAYELPDSGTSLVGSTFEKDSNVNVAGKWMFEISSTAVTAPTSTPIFEPVAVPVSTPISTPVKAPVAAPVSTPVSTPVSPPVKAPVATPISPPVKAPVATPVATPVSTPVSPPVKAPVATPVAVPVSAPTTPVSVTTSRRSVGNAITTSAPYYSVLMDHPLTPPASLLGPIPKPYPTNSWHMNMWLNQGNMPIVTSPYIVEVRNTGVQVSYSARTFTSTSGITVFTENFAMLVKETIAQRQVLDWDLLSVTMIWSNNQPTAYDANTINYGTRSNSMIAPLVQGSPYITTKWDGLTPVITTVHAILSINGATGTTFSGTKFKMVLNNGQTWILYASNSITFTWSGSTLTATNTYTGVLRGVCMTDSSFETTLDQYKDSVPIASKVGWTATGDTAVLEFDYITEDDSAPLMMTLPHHRDMMSGVTYVMNNAYVTMKGKMSGLVSKSWKMTEQLTTITWTAPRSIPSDKVDAIRTALQADQTLTQTASDTYASGKNLAAIARLALIADEIGETTIATNIRTRLKTLLQNWFTGQSSDKIIYDHTWGGVTSSNGIKDSGADYGVGYYNDVHFHFGYFVYASAVVAKGDSAWATTWAPAINDLVRAYANPVHDSYFPVTRMKDWFAGHSWASGLFEFGDVKNQESSSESINGYYGMYLWGLVSNNANLRDLGRVMLAQEIRSTKKYWHMDNKSNDVYDQVFADNGCVGIVWGLKIDFATWFGSNIEYIIGIQMMPYTPITEEYMTSTWVNTVYPTLSTALTRASPVIEVGWKGFIYMTQAVLDKATAWTNINTLSGWDNGNTKTNALYWIATRA